MFTTLFNTGDITSSALAAATMGCFAAAGLLALGLDSQQLLLRAAHFLLFSAHTGTRSQSGPNN